MRLLCLALLIAATSRAEQIDVWIGTATSPGGPSRGIYRLTFDDEAGRLSEAKLVAETTQPGFLAKHPSLPVIYSTIDSGGGGVAAWRIESDGAEKKLVALGDVPTGDGGPCQVSVDRTGRVLFSAQYGGGSVASYRLNDDGSIAGRATLIEHEDPSGVVPGRQGECHAHWTGVTPDNRYVLSPDLGADRVYVHALNEKTGELTRHGSVRTPPGGGPRHFAFHPNGRVGFVVNELAMTVSTLGYDAGAGELTLLSTARALTPEQVNGERFNSGSEVRVHPSGKFVYSANRGHDTVSAFRIDQATGELTLVDNEPVRGSHPRNFNLDPSGRWLIAAGRDSHTLTVFEIDQETGELEYTLQSVYCPSPICVLFAE